MPKPTFLQSVLRKPTRSYADPYAASPWADYDEDDGQSYNDDRAGPSRPRRNEYSDSVASSDYDYDRQRTRAPASIASHSVGGSELNTSMSSRFPKPARKATSSVILRNGEIVHLSPASKTSNPTEQESPRRRKKKEADPSNPSPLADSPSGSSVKRTGTRKKKKVIAPSSPIDHAETESILSSITSSTALTDMYTFSRPPPIRSQYSETSSSAASTPGTPVSPIDPTGATGPQVLQASKPTITTKQANVARPPVPRPLLTPPSSEMSTPNSTMQTVPPLPRSLATVPPPTPRLIVASMYTETDDEDEPFYTPRSSMETTRGLVIEDVATPKAPLVQVHQPANPTMTLPPPPSFNFLPPTPAPIPDPPTSPFHHITVGNSSSLHPDRPSTRPTSPALSSLPTYSSDMYRQGGEAEEDAQSASGQVGSDGEAEPEPQYRDGRRPSLAPSAASSNRDRSRGPSRSVKSGGTPASSVDGRSVSRQSSRTHTVRKSFDDFVVHHRRPSRPTSEASFGEGSIRGSASGYGKGGWAAAAAASSNGGRSGRASPVMFMPTGGNEWAQFHQPPPPRQSRFTPLPPASHPPTFEKLVNGSRGGTSLLEDSAPTSYSGLRPSSRGESVSSSDSSQISDSLPRPSRSYANRDYSNETSRTPSESDDIQESEYAESRTPALGSIAFPQARIQSPEPAPAQAASSMSRPVSRAASLYNSPRPMSPAQYHSSGQPVERAQSPIPSRPASRAGFEPPSFLDPDLLTILPEMSNEDSDRLYRPTPSESGWGRKTPVQESLSRRSSIFKAKSEIGIARYDDEEDEDELGELPQNIPRSKSVVGYRPSGSNKWEGSSYGDGVLMESHGRTQESTGGYTNLILPSGAYRPTNPAKRVPDLDSRILGLPHATMASITLNSTAHRFAATPQHLRADLPPLVDFSSHLKPPTKVGNSQLLVHVYAVAVDEIDVNALNDKGKGDIGKWVPGRSFVGRCLAVGADEKEVVRGDIVMGLVDVRKSGVLSEYIIADRRRISRAPFPTQLSLEQLSLLPLQGISACRAVRTHTVRHTRALISGADSGIPALICQELSRAGVNVTAVIPGGDDSHSSHMRCIENGARGVLMGSLAAVMLNLDEGGWDFIVDDKGGQRVYDAARRLLKDGGKLVSTVRAEHTQVNGPIPKLTSRPSGLKTLRAAFGSKRKESKFIQFEYIHNAGSGEPEVDGSGMDFRDVMEEPCMAIFRPVLHASPKSSALALGMGNREEGGEGMKVVVPFERGAEVFKLGSWDGIRVIRLIN